MIEGGGIIVGIFFGVVLLLCLVIVPLLAVTAPMIGFMLAGIKLVMRDDDASWRAFFIFGGIILAGALWYKFGLA